MIYTQLIKTNLSSQYFGKQIIYYPELESTNEMAWELLNIDNADHGTLIITDNQIKGKGRNNNSWFSSPNKGLTISLILKQEIHSDKVGLIPLVAGICIIKLLEKFSVSPHLKWPNDILIDEKKIAGVLCKSRWTKKKIRAIVVGFGMNVNETKNDFPNKLRSCATSLGIETGNYHQLENLTAILINIFGKYWVKLNESSQEIITEWISLCGHLNQKVSFNYLNTQYDGIFKGIDNKGQAIISIKGNDKIFPSIILN